MVKNFFSTLVAGFLLASAATCSCASDLSVGQWAGTYEYEGTFGQTAGSTPVIIDMTLTLKSNGACELQSEGYMKDEHILCVASPRDTGIDIFFNDYSSDQNTQPTGNYKRGDLLFELTKKNGVILTRWGKAKPFFRLKNVGKYFE
jgi:hypothetical protein